MVCRRCIASDPHDFTGGGPLNESQVTLHKFLAIIWNSCFNTKVMFISRAVSSFFMKLNLSFGLVLGPMGSL